MAATRYRLRGNDHQLVYIGHSGTVEETAARLDLPDHAASGLRLLDLNPIADQRTHTVLTEFSAGAALEEGITADIDVVESAERLDDSSSAHWNVTVLSSQIISFT